jgi:hypothetical protein
MYEQSSERCERNEPNLFRCSIAATIDYTERRTENLMHYIGLNFSSENVKVSKLGDLNVSERIILKLILSNLLMRA